jgi:hypothetical protein
MRWRTVAPLPHAPPTGWGQPFYDVGVSHGGYADVRAFALPIAMFVAFSVALGLAEGRAWAAPLDPGGEDWEGLADFVRLTQKELESRRVVIGARLDLGELSPDDTLVLVHPERELDADELEFFMHAGGNVVLLDDFGTADGVLAHFHMRRVPLPQRPARMLRGNPVFAIAEPASSHPAVSDVPHVVTNHATGISDYGLKPLLVVRGQGEPDVLLAVVGAVGAGHLLAVGDASIVMNSMLRYPGNRAFALSVVRFAAGDRLVGGAPARGRVFVLANDFVITGRYGENAVAGGIRRSLRGLLDAFRQGLPPLAAYLAALLVGLGVVVWASARAGRTHSPSPPRYVRPTSVAAQGGVAGHAASLAAPGASRAAILVELKSAVEEALATRLGMDRLTRREELVARAAESGLLGPDAARSLGQLLARLGRAEDALARRDRGGLERFGRVSDAELAGLAATAHAILAAALPVRHGKVSGLP